MSSRPETPNDPPPHNGGDAPAVGPTEPRRPGAIWRHALAIVLYAALAVALTWPLTRDMATKMAIKHRRSYMVSYHHAYVFAWYHHVFDQGLRDYWNPNVFYPHPRALTYSESLLAPSLLTWPAHLATKNATLAYNLVVLSAFFLNGLCTYVLAVEVKLSRWAALLAGGALAFCPYMLNEIYCPSMLLLYPVPLLFAALHRLVRRPTWPGAVLVGVCGLWMLTTCYQYTLFCAVFAALWIAWFARRIPWRRLWYKLLVVGAICCIPVWVLLSPVRSTHREMGFYRSETFSLTWPQLLLPAEDQRLYRSVLGTGWRSGYESSSHNVAFFGLTFGLLWALGAWRAVRSAPNDDDERTRRHAYRFYLICALAAVGLSLGPSVRLAGIDIPGPYALLSLLVPPLGSVRAVYRFVVFGQLFAAILAGIGLQQFVRRAASGWRRRLFGLIPALLLLAESVWVPLHMWEARSRPSDIHPLYERLARIDPDAPLLEMPVPDVSGPLYLDALYMLDSIHTWQPLVNGYASYRPHLYEQLRPVMAHFPSPGSLSFPRALGVQYVLVRESCMPSQAAAAARQSPDLQLIARHESDALYKLTDSKRRSLNDWEGPLRLRIVRQSPATKGFSAWIVLQLAPGQVIPVLPGDRATRWRLTWRDAANQVVLTQEVGVHNSFWLTATKNFMEVPIEVPQRPGRYAVEAVDCLRGETLGSCVIRFR